MADTNDEALRIALEAAAKANETADAAVNAINTIAETLEILNAAIYDVLCGDGDDESSEVGADNSDMDVTSVPPVAPVAPTVGEISGDYETRTGNALFSEMPKLSGELYPMYKQNIISTVNDGGPSPMISVLHVCPSNDLYQHEVSMKVCWCKPTIDMHGGAYLVVHNAMDGREQFEHDKGKLN